MKREEMKKWRNDREIQYNLSMSNMKETYYSASINDEENILAILLKMILCGVMMKILMCTNGVISCGVSEND